MAQPNRIQPLPLHLANQIAAGEVIERPASVVKELVENSLDAHATHIDIRIEGAGSQRIQVRDNGYGIHSDDLPLALSRHATSKLHSSEQLSHIASLGFRGEALPSIASVSMLTLTSRQAESSHGWQIGTEHASPVPAPHPVGTTVEVRDLFFNVPARRHFLRSPQTEQHHILSTLHRLALSQFETGFTYHISDKNPFKLPPATTPQQQQQRLRKICGQAFYHHSIAIEQQYQNITLHGWIGQANFHRPQTDIQYFFINGRVIRDRVIHHAIRQAYGDHIPAGRYPAFVLYLELPLDMVDINVHPTKHEVRFRHARLVHSLITRAIQDALSHSVHPAPRPENPATAPSVRIEAPPAQYQARPHPAAVVEESALSFGQVQAVIAQRYALCQTETDTFLLDCQSIDLAQRRHQLVHAIDQGTLTARPILVPVKIPLDAKTLQQLKQYQSLLNRFALTLQFSSEHILLTTIPTLLAHASLPPLIQALLPLPASDQPEVFIQNTLLAHLPSIPITNQAQAEQIIAQYSPPFTEHEHYIRLDQSRLDGLFSR